MPVKDLNPLHSNQGVSLIELLVVVVLISGVLISMSLMFPRSIKVVHQNRQIEQASVIAQNAMQRIKSQKYALVEITPENINTFTTSATSSPNNRCSCNADPADITITNLPVPPFPSSPANPTYPYNATFDSSGVRYEVRACINFIEPNGTPHCPSSTLPDPGLKNIRLHVRWQNNGQWEFRTYNSQVSRQ